jgi:hypothetical protein
VSLSPYTPSKIIPRYASPPRGVDIGHPPVRTPPPGGSPPASRIVVQHEQKSARPSALSASPLTFDRRLRRSPTERPSDSRRRLQFRRSISLTLRTPPSRCRLRPNVARLDPIDPTRANFKRTGWYAGPPASRPPPWAQTRWLGPEFPPKPSVQELTAAVANPRPPRPRISSRRSYFWRYHQLPQLHSFGYSILPAGVRTNRAQRKSRCLRRVMAFPATYPPSSHRAMGADISRRVHWTFFTFPIRWPRRPPTSEKTHTTHGYPSRFEFKCPRSRISRLPPCPRYESQCLARPDTTRVSSRLFPRAFIVDEFAPAVGALGTPASAVRRHRTEVSIRWARPHASTNSPD